MGIGTYTERDFFFLMETGNINRTGNQTGTEIRMETTKKNVFEETGNKNGNGNRNESKNINWKRNKRGTSKVKKSTCRWRWNGN